MVKVGKITPSGDTWLVELQVYDGVYQMDRYPVRVEHVPLPPGDAGQDERSHRMAEFVLTEVRRHMRRGSLPPRGTRLDGREVWHWAPSPAGE